MPTSEFPQVPSDGQNSQTIKLPEKEETPESVVEFRIRWKETARTQVDQGLSQETALKRLGREVTLFPRSPFDTDEKTGAVTPAQFVIGAGQERRGDITTKFAYSGKQVGFTLQETTALQPKDVMLVPLPTQGQAITLQGGIRADGVTAHTKLTIMLEQGRYVVRGEYGQTVPLPQDFEVSTHEQITREKYIVSPQDRQGEVTQQEVVHKKDEALLAARVVTADGIPSLLVEGVSDVVVSQSKQAVDMLRTYYEKRATRHERFSGGIVASTPSRKHPLRNEDVALRTPDGVSVVLDGMGSYQNGGVHTGYEHSRLAEAVVKESLSARGIQKDPIRQLDAFVGALTDAHNVLKRNLQVPGDTTAVLTKIMQEGRKQHVLVWANVGDSRVMVLRNGKILQVSEDDNVLEDYYHAKGLDTWIAVPSKIEALQLFEAGFPYDEAAGKIYFSREQVHLMQQILDRFHGFGMFATDSFLGHFFKNSNVTRGLKENMLDPRVDIHRGIFPLERGDIVLTMSDGVSDPVSQEDFEIIARRVGKDPQRLVIELQAAIRKTNDHPSEYNQRVKEDDTSLIVEVVE